MLNDPATLFVTATGNTVTYGKLAHCHCSISTQAIQPQRSGFASGFVGQLGSDVTMCKSLVLYRCRCVLQKLLPPRRRDDRPQERGCPCLVGRILEFGLLQHFRFYLAISVQSWTNQAQNVRLAIFNQTVQLVFFSSTFTAPCTYRKI